MTKLQARFKDSITHPHKNSVVLMTAISCGNQGQTGDNWDHFCDLVEHYYKEESIEKLIVVTTGGLQWHYMSLGSRSLSAQEIEQKIHEFDRQWVTKNIKIPSKYTFPIEIISWQDLLNKSYSMDSQNFDEFFKKIREDYDHHDREFKNLVNKHASTYVTKKMNRFVKEKIEVSYEHFLKVAVNYVLEECAAIFQLHKCKADLFTYPGGINPPGRHIWNKYFKDSSLKYIRYEIKLDKSLQSDVSASSLSKSNFFKEQPCHLTCYIQCNLKAHNWNLPQEIRFIQEFNKLIHQIDHYAEFYKAQQEAIDQRRTITHRSSI
ncbi:MAG: hypothetical protein E6K54_07690 [Gammaproteobacteria bacterium]|nr:MAG: hypothetical protein E6K54_07690 [Gammaproteobacteria bacterium]